MAGNGDHDLKVQMVELLAVGDGNALLGSPPKVEPVVVITLRPEPERCFRPHNIAISRSQAERLCEDLVNLLERSVVFLAVLAVGFAGGCSARYETRSETTSNMQEAATTEKSAMATQVDLLRNDAPAPSSVSPDAQTPSRGTGRSEEKSGNTVIINVGSGDVHVHEPPRISDKEARKSGQPCRSSGLNTRIGWPSDYWQHGPSAFLGFVTVCLLVGTAVGLMAVTCPRSEGGPMFPILGLLFLAALVLQTLPTAESGLQFLPLPPWDYSGFLPICISILCWASLILATIVVVCDRSKSTPTFSGYTLISMGLNVLLSLFAG